LHQPARGHIAKNHLAIGKGRFKTGVFGKIAMDVQGIRTGIFSQSCNLGFRQIA
jgi:hypothetical protein